MLRIAICITVCVLIAQDEETEAYIDKKLYSRIYDGINAVFFILLGIMFLVTGELIMRRLFAYHLDFYDEQHRRIAVSTYGLTIPLLIRGIYEAVAYFNDYLQ
jgi:hypothetical protein